MLPTRVGTDGTACWTALTVLAKHIYEMNWRNSAVFGSKLDESGEFRQLLVDNFLRDLFQTANDKKCIP